MTQANFGVVGMAVMGKNLALNVESRGYTVALFNRTTAKTEEVVAEHPDKNFVLTKTIGDMKALVDAGLLDEFNVGNISKQGEDSVQVKKSVFLSPQDIEQLKELTENGTKITARMVPGESDASIMSMIDDK